MAYLCFDIGSSTLKAALLSEGGELLSLVRRPLSPASGEGGRSETDASAWIDAALSAGAEAVSAASDAKGVEVRALSVSGNGPTLVAVGADGKPLGPALSWLDRRASREADELSALAGMRIDSTFNPPKALRLWRNAPPALRDRIRWFFSCPEYLVYALCGEACTYLPRTGYEPYVLSTGPIAALGLPPDRFPPCAPPAARIGSLLSSVAERLGIEAGIPVIAGFPDFLAAIVGSATIEIGAACDRSGTSEAINICSDRPFPTPALLSLPHPVEGLWNLSGGVSSAGAAVEWIAAILDPERKKKDESTVPELLAEARLSPPGANGLVFLPYLAGERAPLWDSSRRASFVGLSLEHGRRDLARAVCESLAYGLKLASDLARDEGRPFDLLRVSGPAAGDDFLCTLKADILGVPVEAPEICDCELVGDAAACALALGEARSLSESALSLVRIRRRFEPIAADAYERAFEGYAAALQALEIVDHSR